jgi:RNA polymerase sigma-70 factor (ECF subfamily)
MIFSHHALTKKLVQGCLDQNRKFQKQLFDMYKDAMYTLAFRILRSEELAEDAVQEGFLQVFNNISKYRFEASLGSWIKTIMVRNALKMLKNESLITEQYAEDHNVTISWDDNLTGEMLDKAISELSPGYRTVFLLIETEGYSHKEVAEILNISEGTSKSQLSRAKVILQEKLKEIRN